MAKTQFSYVLDDSQPEIPMKYNHFRILRILSNYSRYTSEIREIAFVCAGHDLHPGTLTPRLAELVRWGFIVRDNPDVPKCLGYKFSITPNGLRALQTYDETDKRMALAPSKFVYS